MPKLDYEKKLSLIIRSPGAFVLFKTMHQLFTHAKLDLNLPPLMYDEKERVTLAAWWDAQFKLLPLKAKDAEVERHRNSIVRDLRNISLSASPDAPALKRVYFFSEPPGRPSSGSVSMAQGFRGLVEEISKKQKQMLSDPRWASFENASASVLLRVSAYIEAGKWGMEARSIDSIEARLKLAEETQRLLEFVGDPPSDLRIRDNEGAAEYFKAVMPSLAREILPEPPGDVILDILKTLESRERDPENPQYLNDLARACLQLRKLFPGTDQNQTRNAVLSRVSKSAVD